MSAFEINIVGVMCISYFSQFIGFYKWKNRKLGIMIRYVLATIILHRSVYILFIMCWINTVFAERDKNKMKWLLL